MGWLANLVFGDPNYEQKGSGVLPKAVESWKDASGKTQSEAAANQAPVEVEGQAIESRLRDARGLKIVPEVEVIRVQSKPSSDMKHCDVWIQFKNNSEVEVEVTQISFLRQKLRFGRFLKPGESHEERVYSGDTPENDSERRCEVLYRVCENGDYFQADHLVEYDLEREGDENYYLPSEMKLISPVHDV